MTSSQAFGGGQIAYKWWRALNPSDGKQSGAARAALARLRRAATPVDVMLEREAMRLITMLPHRPKNRVAILAGVLAWVREADEVRVARAIGRMDLDDDQSATVSEVRFRRLLQSQDFELMDPMRRLVRQMKGRANVGDIADTILYWGEEAKRKWIFDYYAATAAASTPGANTGPSLTSQQDSTND